MKLQDLIDKEIAWTGRNCEVTRDFVRISIAGNTIVMIEICWSEQVRFGEISNIDQWETFYITYPEVVIDDQENVLSKGTHEWYQI